MAQQNGAPPGVKVLGIDPGLTRLAVVAAGADGWYETAVFGSQPSGRRVRERDQRYKELAGHVMQAFDRFKPTVTLIEGYSLGSRGSALSGLIELGYLLRADLCETDTMLYEVAPICLKKFATGTGKGDKTRLIAGITKRWGVEFDCTDLYDAFGLAQMALTIADIRKPATEAERQAIATVLR